MSDRRRRRSGGLNRKLRRYKLFQVFQQDRLFAYAFAAFVVVMLAVGVAVPKVWRTVPKDFPITTAKISLIDRLQAWSLSRSARRAVAAGNFEASITAWQGAAANNPGDVRIHRGILQVLRDAPGQFPDFENLIPYASRWLLDLTHTNATDVTLVAHVLERYGNPDAALGPLKAFPEGQNDLVDGARLRCLLSAEQFEDFQRLWALKAATWAADPILALYHDAWQMATDNTSVGIEAALRLKTAVRDSGSQGLLAARLLSLAASRRGLVDDLDLALRRLDTGHATTVAQYSQYWRLLAASGREDEARSQASAFVNRPIRDARSAARFVDVLRSLKLNAEAIQFLESNIKNYGMAVDVWRPYFDLLIEARNWSEVRRVTTMARMGSSKRDTLYAEALFAEYQATRAQDRQREATDLLREIGMLELSDPVALARITGGLRADGRVDKAFALLRANEKILANYQAFWSEWFATGRALRDINQLRRAVSELLRINPNSTVWVNNRAALLLITGENPAEALQLTLAGLGRQPNSPPFRINHAIALLMNDRPTEARQVLSHLDASRLDPDSAANFHLAMAEIHAAEGHADDAQAAAKQVDRERLLPQQLERLDRALAQLASGAPRG